MEIKLERISLSNLYESESVRNTVWDVLTEDFEDTFNRLLKEGVNFHSKLIKKALPRKSMIQELVIEYGYKFETLDDLKKCLDTLKMVDKSLNECDLEINKSKISIDESDSGCDVLKDQDRVIKVLTMVNNDDTLTNPPN